MAFNSMGEFTVVVNKASIENLRMNTVGGKVRLTAFAQKVDEAARTDTGIHLIVKDHILRLNGETVTDDHDGVAKLKAAPDGDVTFVVSRPDENGILRTEVRTAFAGTHTIEWVSETKVELTDKNNQAVILACCCPGCVQNFMWVIDFANGVANVSDGLYDLNRIKGYLANPCCVALVSTESGKINGMAAQVALNVKMKENARANASNPTAVPVATVVPDTMSRYEPKVDIATQLEKLNGLKESGAISEEEFAEAKAKALATA